MNCPVCGCPHSSLHFTVARDEPDMYATAAAGLGQTQLPRAEYCECAQCEAMYWLEKGCFEHIYDGFAYAAETGDAATFIRERFQKVIALPAHRSDNVQRVRRIREFLLAHSGESVSGRNVADIGAGMGVFLHGFLDGSWRGSAIEPDPCACTHMRQVLPAVRVVQAYIAQARLPERQDLITINRTLEHVPDPVTFLGHAARMLKDCGIAYVELPDVRAYYHNGPHDPDFGYGHYVVYSPTALAMAGARAGLDLLNLNRVQEPSGKFTIYGFFSLRNEANPSKVVSHGN